MVRIYAEIDGKRYTLHPAYKCPGKRVCSLCDERCRDDKNVTLPCMSGKFKKVYDLVWEMADSSVAFKEVKNAE